MADKGKYLGNIGTERLIQYIKSIPSIYVDEEAPLDAPENTLWLDLDEEPSGNNGVLIGAKDGLSIFYIASDVQNTNSDEAVIVHRDYIKTVDRAIQTGDLLLSQNGLICSVIELKGSNEVLVNILADINGDDESDDITADISQCLVSEIIINNQNSHIEELTDSESVYRKIVFSESLKNDVIGLFNECEMYPNNIWVEFTSDNIEVSNPVSYASKLNGDDYFRCLQAIRVNDPVDGSILTYSMTEDEFVTNHSAIFQIIESGVDIKLKYYVNKPVQASDTVPSAAGVMF